MDLIDSRATWDDYAFYFGGKLSDGLVARIWRFRTEREYDFDQYSVLTAVSIVHGVVSCVGKRAFLLLASDVGTQTALRSKKGVLWNYKGLRERPYLESEVKCSNGQTRLGAVVELSADCMTSDTKPLLNWGQGLIVLSSGSLTEIARLTSQWVSADSSDVLAFDFDAISETLRRDSTLGILRYFPPDNSRTEAVVIAADKSFVSEEMCRCVEVTLSPSNGDKDRDST